MTDNLFHRLQVLRHIQFSIEHGQEISDVYYEISARYPAEFNEREVAEAEIIAVRKALFDSLAEEISTEVLDGKLSKYDECLLYHSTDWCDNAGADDFAVS